jgi:hypothetical protein
VEGGCCDEFNYYCSVLKMDLAHLHMFLSPLASVGLVMYLSVADPDLTHV